jgi:ABC-type lipoprotein export system ATPase subunit/uncharacterized protein (UPF0335 family)
MPTIAKYPRGSEWRKWDLHIHSPGTKKNDGYKGSTGNIWDEYCKRIEDSDVQVFGITDYFSADGYFNTINEFRKRYARSTKTFFPNIELCTNDVVNKPREEVNLHAIFNSSVSSEKIKEFLSNLKTNSTNSSGRNFTAAELKSKTDFEQTTTTREFIKETLDRTFGAKAELTDYLLIITAINNDGIRAERGAKRKATISDELDKFSDGFFGNSNNTAYYLDPKRLESGDRTEAKPVVAGSDAHSLKDLDDWLGKVLLRDGQLFKQSTWIKADPTFEGLKQIIFEPADRVFIGDEPEIETQVRNNPRRYLKTLHVRQIEGYGGRFGSWFKDERIELNKELVAVIGNKGSGKSAFTDILGLLGNSHNQRYDRIGKAEELFSFLNREKFLKANCAANFIGEIHWYAGTPDSAQLDASVDTTLPETLEYLPQKYLEKICTNIDDDEFRHKLNEVIFRYVREDDRYGTNSLDELVTYLTSQATADITAAVDALHQHNENVVLHERKVTSGYKNEVESRIKLMEAEVAAHIGARPTVVQKPPEVDATTSSAEIGVLGEKIKALIENITAAEKEKVPIAKQAQDLYQARQAIERQANAIRGLESSYKSLFEDAGVKFADIVKITIDFAPLDSALQSKHKRVNELVSLLQTKDEINALGLDPGGAEKAVQISLVCQRDILEAKRKELVDRLDKPNRDFQNYLRHEGLWQAKHAQLLGPEENPPNDTLNWFKQELRRITDTYPGELKSLRAERESASKDVFTKKKKLVDFYTAVKHSIDREIATYKDDLRGYAISIEAGLRLDSVFFDDFSKFINQAVKGSYCGSEEGKTQLKRQVEQVGVWDDMAAIFQFLNTIVDYLDTDRRPSLPEKDSKIRDIFRQLKEKKDPVEFYDFLFGFSYLKTKYDLKVDGKDLSELSPGERGGLLLVFYLMLDKREIPLVIDQPEDNLDNKSVYEILVTFLKKAKRRRQIIIATHNPNLAVVADAEQIIHVSIDKTGQGAAKNDFSFRAGAIEDTDINKLVVDILEGTLPAFDNRRLKYRKQPSQSSSN